MKQHEILYHFFKVKGKKEICFCVSVQADYHLKVLGVYYIHVPNDKKLPANWHSRTRHYLPKSGLKNLQAGGLGMPYQPAAEPPVKSLETIVPDSMAYEIHAALYRLKKEVGNINAYVRRYMGYASDDELAGALSAEQVDAVALAIYNIEVRKEALIVGDQTGIGKGRVAASLIRIFSRMGLKPVFLTEKPNLFSDIYRDLAAIGSANLVPFIVNGREGKTQVKDEDGNVVYEAPEKIVQDEIINHGRVSENYDYVMATYSQFASKTPTVKQTFLKSVAANNVLILDESHNAGGDMDVSATATLFYEIVEKTRGVLFLSATFAKRPDNMPLYTVKTCMREAAMDNEELVAAINRGGVALQEVLAATLVNEGQMIRRERSFEGVEVNYITLDGDGKKHFGVEDLENEQLATADRITDIIRDIIRMEKDYIVPIVEEMDEAVKAEMMEVIKREGTADFGVYNTPYFSKLFNVINQMLFSIKAKAVADRAIQRLLEGKKPVIAFASTMGAFLENMENDRGGLVGDGDTIKTDFSEVLNKGLENIFKITVVKANGKREKEMIDLSELPEPGQNKYHELRAKIREVSTGISISPIDDIKHYIEQAGFSVAEITGRRLEVQYEKPGNMTALVRNRRRENVSDAFRKFNNNQVDVLLINQSGSTGASAHAIVTPRVPLAEVKQRVMIVLQPELDINKEIQKRGRINRTGQVYKPIYDYINSAIPAEQRLVMMLQRKLKSLDANTTSNQKQSKSILDSPDFLNKYGDAIVKSYLEYDLDLNYILGDPLGISSDRKPPLEGMALKTTGRVAVLPCESQRNFYDVVFENYNNYVDYLKQSGLYDLEVEEMDLQAETIEREPVVFGKGGRSDFGTDTYLELIDANVLKKPLTKPELERLVEKALDGKTAGELRDGLLQEMADHFKAREEDEIREAEQHFDELLDNITSEKKYREADNKKEYHLDRTIELEDSRDRKIDRVKSDLQRSHAYLRKFVQYFHIGRSLLYPTDVAQDQIIYTPSVFLGFRINRNRARPFIPSAIRACIAIADSNRYMELVLSNEQGGLLNSIMEKTEKYSKGDTLANWETYCRKSNVNRIRRYVYTGNVLQAFTVAEGGKLVDYTCKNGEKKKGLLMPLYWDMSANKGKANMRRVPLKFCRRAILGLSVGAVVNTDADISFMLNREGTIKVLTSSLSVKTHGWLIKDTEILQYITDNGGFQKQSSSWTGNVVPSDLPRVIDLIYKSSNCNALLSLSQVDMIKQDIIRAEVKPKEKIELPPPDEDMEMKLKLAKAKAIAKMKILNLLNL